MVRTVSSLSWLSGRLQGTLFKDKSAVGRIVVDCLFFPAFWCIAIWASRAGTIWSSNKATRIIWATCTLLLWYIITIIDLFLHEAQLKVPYNYFMIEVVLATLKFLVETLLVWNTHFIVATQLYKYVARKFAKGAIVFGEILVVIMIIMAIYSTGSMIGHRCVWLRMADPDLVGSLGMPQARFEAAFFILQWFVASFTLFYAIVNWLYEYYDSRCSKTSYIMLAASFCYWMTSMSEMAFSIKFHLKQKTPAKDTGLARDALFGLFVFLYLFCLSFDVSPTRRNSAETLVDAGPNPRLLTKMQEESRRYMLQRLEDTRHDNETVLPSFHTLVGELQQDRGKALTRQTRDDMEALNDDDRTRIEELYDGFLRNLDRRHGHMRVDMVPREF